MISGLKIQLTPKQRAGRTCPWAEVGGPLALALCQDSNKCSHISSLPTRPYEECIISATSQRGKLKPGEAELGFEQSQVYSMDSSLRHVSVHPP